MHLEMNMLGVLGVVNLAGLLGLALILKFALSINATFVGRCALSLCLVSVLAVALSSFYLLAGFMASDESIVYTKLIEARHLLQILLPISVVGSLLGFVVYRRNTG